MKATELRIGNYVYDHDLKLCKIVSIHENGRIRVELPSIKDVPLGSFNVAFAKEIPLTEEILLKCGFGYWEDVDEWYSPNESATLRISHYTNGEKIGFYEGDYDIEIKYLHQLQNLYFALTGEELNIEL